METELEIQQQKQKQMEKPMPPNQKTTFWESTEARMLFCPLPDEGVQECLARRVSIMMEATTDDEVLLQIIDADSMEDITPKARQNLRYKCIYIKKA